MTRTESLILHVDVDAFFASVEQLLIPSLRGRAVIVGSGCIASCSYEARRAGLRAGMELHAAMRRCRSAVILPGRYPIYRCFAEHVWEICRRYTCGLETYLDEAYGDATGMPQLRAGGPEAMGVPQLRQGPAYVGIGLQDAILLGQRRYILANAEKRDRQGLPGVDQRHHDRCDLWIAAQPRRVDGLGL